MTKNIPPRLQQAIDANKIVRSLGDYDSAIVGVLGEVYAEEIVGMKKAPRGKTAIDGHIGTRRVSVKAKESDKQGRYVEISAKKRSEVDELIIVVLRQNGEIWHYGPIPMNSIGHLFTGNKGRLPLASLDRNGIMPIYSGIDWI